MLYYIITLTGTKNVFSNYVVIICNNVFNNIFVTHDGMIKISDDRDV